MVTVLQENLAFFQKYDPEFLKESWRHALLEPYPVVATRAQEVTVEVDQLWVHSRVHALKEAEKQLAQRPFDLHFGFGLGYFAKAAQITEQPMAIFEPDPRLLWTALNHLDLRFLSQNNLFLFGDFRRLQLFLETTLLHRETLRLFALPYHLKRHAATWGLLQKKIRGLMEAKAFFSLSEQKYGDLFARSTLFSLPFWLQAPPIDRLFQQLKRPAVLALPGPSLKKNLFLLKRFRSTFTLFAVSRSMSMLEERGITPDYMAHLEAQDFCEFIQGRANVAASQFLLEEQTHWKYWQVSRQTWCFHNHLNPVAAHLVDTYPELKRLSVPCGGSVATSLLSLAVLLGCSPIILVGQDLAMSTKGSFYINQHDDTGARVQRPGYFGGTVTSRMNYHQFGEWLSEAVQEFKHHFPRTHFVNATEGGSLIEGFDHLPLRHILTRLPRHYTPLPSFPKSRPAIPHALRRLISQFIVLALDPKTQSSALALLRDSFKAQPLPAHASPLLEHAVVQRLGSFWQQTSLENQA